METNKEYKELLQEQKKEREELKQEIEFKSFISDKTKIPFKVYISNLWDMSASVKFKDLFREDNLNKEELNELLELFTPIKMYLVGGNSFRPLLNKINEDCKQVNSYIIKYEGLNQDVLKVIWYTLINGKICKIEAFINNIDFINEFASRTAEREDFKGDYRIFNTRLHLNGNFADGQYKAIKWATGTEHYKNDFTIYTENLDTDFKQYLNK